MEPQTEPASITEQLLVWVYDLTAYVSCEDFARDETLRMDIYRILILAGIEAEQLQLTACSVIVRDRISGFAKADFLHGLGQDHYAMLNFLTNDIPWLLENFNQHELPVTVPAVAKLSA